MTTAAPSVPSATTGAPPRQTVACRLRTLALTLALALAAAVATAQDTGDPDPVLLQLGSTVERLSDISWRFDVAVRSYLAGQGVPYSAETAARLHGLMPTYLEQRASEVVLLREAARRGLLADQATIDATLERIRGTVQEGEDYATALAQAGFASEEHLVTLIRESDLISQVVSAIADEVEPTDEQVRVRYRAEIAQFTVPESFCARHILVADEALAAGIVADVRAGADFAALAAEHGTDATASRGGDLGCFGRGQMVAPFEEAVAAAAVGEVTGPVQTQFGYHAILVYERDPARVLPLADVEDEVREQVRGTLVDAQIDGLLRGAAALTFPERIPAQ